MESNGRLTYERGLWIGRFQAMAAPCEVLIDIQDAALAAELFRLAREEACRIEQKFSRHLPDNMVDRINRARGKPIEVDEETAYLLDLSAAYHRLSGGMFDITSGLLGKVWRFDGGDRLPDIKAVAALLPRVGWSKVRWNRPFVTLLPGMEIDFGGIEKEYAVDRTAQILSGHLQQGVLIHYGDNFFTLGPCADGRPWRIEIDDPGADGRRNAIKLLLSEGGLVTHGSLRRCLIRNNIRYSDTFDPRTGWPVISPPRSVTVLAATCIEASRLATFALLQGGGAVGYLEEEGGAFWRVAN